MKVLTRHNAVSGGDDIRHDPAVTLIDTPLVTMSVHDGYIRLTYSCLQQLPLQHMYSEVDAGVVTHLAAHAIHSSAAGFTEWQSATSSTLSIGWDWYLDDQSERLSISPEPVRSNLMLRDSSGYDLGPNMTSNLLRNWLLSLDWQGAVTAALHPRLIIPCQV